MLVLKFAEWVMRNKVSICLERLDAVSYVTFWLKE